MTRPRFALRVAGQWLASIGPWSALKFSTVANGGSGTATWSMLLPHNTVGGSVLQRGAIVEILAGATPLYRGTLSEPEPGDGEVWNFTAQGLHTQADTFLAFDGALNASRTPDVAIDAAIGRGLPWKRPISISGSPFTPTDGTTGLSYLGPLLDDWATSVTKRWGVDAYGNVYAAADPTTPAWYMAPGSGRFGLTDDGYASDVYLRWGDGAGNYATTHAGAPTAAARFGVKELGEDYTDYGAFTTSIATAIANGELGLGLPRLSWTNTVSPDRWQITDAGGSPAQLWLVRGGQMVALRGVPDDQGKPVLSATFVIGEATYDVDADTLTLAPVGMVSRSSVGDMLASLTDQTPAGTLATVATGAQQTATTALASADGKNTVWYQDTPPTGDHKENDTWFDTANDYRINTWNGSAWVPFQLGTDAIADLSIIDAKIANATISSAKISYIDAGKITVGTLSAIDINGVDIYSSNLYSAYISSPNIVAASLSTATSGYRVAMGSAYRGSSEITFYNGSSASGWILLDSSGFYIENAFSDPIRIQSSGQLQLYATNSGVYLEGGYVASQTIYGNTSSNAANLIISVGGGATFYRSTSVRASKLDVQPMTADDVRGLLDAPISTWFDRGDSERWADYLTAIAKGEDPEEPQMSGVLRRIPGLVAEDVEAVPGGDRFVTYDEKNAVSGLMYDRIGVAWIPLVKELTDQLAALTARVATLEGTPTP